MRLLRLADDGNLAFQQFSDDNTPPYAILSHTWSTEEVFFEELMNGSGKERAGYRKLEFCGKQAARDGLRYFWVDTCCIDKWNHFERSVAINSMFRWYRNAARCYALLSDVSTRGINDAKIEQSSWQQAFRGSRWFKRGWTLQELIAPASVIFFSAQYDQLGDKLSLQEIICETSGISIAALHGQSLDTFSVAERMSWSERRHTSEPEDLAYCLLGIFDIHMPVRYGEGKENARQRLLNELSCSRDQDTGTFFVPFQRNGRFTGFELQLAKLEEKLLYESRNPRIAITGLGGAGKTQLALELAYRTSQKNGWSVLWIPATDAESFHRAYSSIAQRLNIMGWDDEKTDVIKLVQRYLSGDGLRRWLLIFDDVHSAELSGARDASSKSITSNLLDCLPSSKQGRIVFTTRDRGTAVRLASSNILEVPILDENAAKEMLQKHLINSILPHEQGEADALLRELTYSPLALVQAATYININRITIHDYRTLLAGQEKDAIELLSKDFVDEWSYGSAKTSVGTTWFLTFSQIRHQDALAADYLSFMACLERTDIPLALLPSGQSREKEAKAIDVLVAYSVIDKRDGSTVEVHRLIHLAMRNWLRQQDLLEQWTEEAVSRLLEIFPSHDYSNRTLWKRILPHVRYVLASRVIGQESNATVHLAWKYAMALYIDGCYDEAAILFRDILELWSGSIGQNHPDTLATMANLASTYRNQGRWKETEELEVQVMRTRKTVLGEDHPDTLTSMANLALTYWNQGRWKEAEELEVQVIEIRKKVLGEEHPHTLTSMANLASIYKNQGRWKEAEELEMQVMQTFKRALGEDHPSTLTSTANLASTYRNQGRWKEAEELELQAIEAFKRVLGEEHPDTLASIANLASTYWNQGRWKEAEELEVRVKEIRERQLGEEHPDTLTSIANLASTYLNQGRWTEAERLEVQVLEKRKQVLGEGHPDTLTSMANLALTWRDLGRHQSAIELISSCASLSQISLGAGHPDTVARDQWSRDWKNEER